jgi:small GTP-binding protein
MRRPSSTVRPKNMPILDLEATGPPDRTYKVVFAGDAAVGKTSFINRITKGIFVSNLSSTLGVDFQVKTIRVDERNIALQLWDTAGEFNIN